MRYLFVLGTALLCGCTAQNNNDGTFPEAMASPLKAAKTTAVPARSATEGRETIRGPDGSVYAFAPFQYRDKSDLVAGCPNMNPVRRPRGSNCHGIFPEQCGADLAQSHLGQALSPQLQDKIIGHSPNADVRFNRPGDALIEDLRDGRLNIGVDEDGVITSAD